MYGNIIKCKCHHGLELNSATKQTKERKEIFLDFSKVKREKKKEKIFLLFLQRKNQRRTGKNFKKIKTNKNIKWIIQWKKMRGTRTPPSLGFWPKLGSSTVVLRSLLLRGNGKSKGCMSPPVRTPKSWDPLTKKVSRSKRKKTLHPTR